MAGKTLQNLVDILAELNAGRPVTYAASNGADARRISSEVSQRVSPEARDLLTIVWAKPRSPEKLAASRAPTTEKPRE